ncbi:hypothetical protein [uncultured Clostridium sp.]|uniref:hypothetical protein n=1 Tax=uncultured Clostridium sp. TaxID=59620 RepID=UPI0026359FE4|nr:hypothetical protein [uncultured Clostridium sp.]
MENKWCVRYVLCSDRCSLNTLSLIPFGGFGEGEGKYTSEETSVVVKFIGNYKVPQFDDKFSGWEEFRDKLNKEIYNIYGK